ncbi:hypothetical protein Sjap_003265 [Stephania japonica]|uniref:F-box/LRR-repeat protein 15/At3g58940/PEG3-like LRR domain-containing protein n=1 Tax=Stephania japonica TaxID=461633 RepID=A0AAP0PUW7_9MAGN
MFMNYVDYVLFHHQIPNLRSFKLTCNKFCAANRVHSWVSTVSHHKLRELHLHFFNQEPDVIPTSVYRCESLMMLKISSPRCAFNPPYSISLPSLTTLDFHGLRFLDEDLTQQFFSSLPALETLIIKGCEFHNHQKLVISLPSLRVLNIYAALFEPNELSSPIIKVCAPKLQFLSCETDSLPRQYILSNMPVLEVVMLNAEECGKPVLTLEEVHRNARNLLEDLVNVKKLYIPACLVKSLPHEDFMRRNLPFLTNLTYLEVFRPCSGRDILSVLQIMPNLEYLTFDKAYASSEDELTPYIGEMLPQCFQSRIKEIQINEYDGSLEDFPMIIFLLNNVPALKITTVIDSINDYGDPVETIWLRRNSLNS